MSCKDQQQQQHDTCLTNNSIIDNSTWEQFLSCDNSNRQVRMLANYNQLGCNVLKCLTKSANCTQNQKEINPSPSSKCYLFDVSFDIRQLMMM